MTDPLLSSVRRYLKARDSGDALLKRMVVQPGDTDATHYISRPEM